MKTLVTEDIDTAAAILKNGGVVAFPTETVYGLGANAFDAAAIAKVFEAKNRPADNPLIVHVAHNDQISEIVEKLSLSAEKLIARFFPGPLTIVAKGTGKVSGAASADLETIAFRMPNNSLALSLIRKCGFPLVAPSANLSGRPSPTTWQAVDEDMNGRIEGILKGETTEIGIESTVVDCSQDPPVVLRPGGLPIEELRKIVPEIRNFEPDPENIKKSPGLRYKHYSPKAQVLLLRDDLTVSVSPAISKAYIGITAPSFEVDKRRLCSDADEYASAVFEFFRECDRSGVEVIYCQAVPEEGIGLALMDRIKRAAVPTL